MNQLEFNHKFKRGFNVRRLIVVVTVCLLVGYGFFNSRSLIFGPSIEIFEPVSLESEVAENTLLIKGRVKNMTYLSLNGRPIFVNPEGLFEEKLLLSPGFNTIEIRARDRFKTEKVKTIRVYYKFTDNLD
jgi:hypothetical protein